MKTKNTFLLLNIALTVLVLLTACYPANSDVSELNFSTFSSSDSFADDNSIQSDMSFVPNTHTIEYPIMAYSEYVDSLVLIGAYRTDEGFFDVTKYEFGGLSYKELGLFGYGFGDVKPSLQNSLISIGDEVLIFGKEGVTKAICIDLDISYVRDSFAIIKVKTDKEDKVKDSFAIISEQQSIDNYFVASDSEIFCDIDSDEIDEKIWCTTELVDETTVCYTVNVQTNERVYTHKIEDLKPTYYSYRVIGLYDFDNDEDLEILTYVNGLEEQYYILKLEEATLKEKMSIWLSD